MTCPELQAGRGPVVEVNKCNLIALNIRIVRELWLYVKANISLKWYIIHIGGQLFFPSGCMYVETIPIYYLMIYEASRGAWAQVCDCKLDRLWVRSLLEKIKYIIFLFLFSGVEAKRVALPSPWVPPLNRQCLQGSPENGERSFLTLGFLSNVLCPEYSMKLKQMLHTFAH